LSFSFPFIVRERKLRLSPEHIGNDSSTGHCRACLAAAAGNITGGCGGPTARRGGVWSDGCFLAYSADADAARDDDRRKVLCDGDFPRSYLDDDDKGRLFLDNWTFSDPTFYWLLVDLAQRAADEPARTLAEGERRSHHNPGMTVRALAQCTGDDRADCLRCLKPEGVGVSGGPVLRGRRLRVAPRRAGAQLRLLHAVRGELPLWKPGAAGQRGHRLLLCAGARERRRRLASLARR
jgi:hypothetical protein